jgi:hypothetical protein
VGGPVDPSYAALLHRQADRAKTWARTVTLGGDFLSCCWACYRKDVGTEEVRLLRSYSGWSAAGTARAKNLGAELDAAPCKRWESVYFGI